jgi:hypothetical protein
MAQSTFSFSKPTVTFAVKSFHQASKAEETAAVARNMAGAKMVDELTIACDMADKAKYFDKVKARAACIEVFTAAGLSESAIKNYPMSVKLAFIHGVPFATSLFTKQGKEAAGIATPSAGTASDGKSGKVKTTTQAETDKTFSKVLAQLRMLKQTMVAAELLDVYFDAFPEFKETVL